jgi:hypothetical protein
MNTTTNHPEITLSTTRKNLDSTQTPQQQPAIA